MTAERARVAAHIGVLNEAQVIRPCIEHLRRIGVSDIVVFDLNSTDGTREILAGMEGPGFTVVDFPEDGTDRQLMQMAQQSLRDSLADWCILMDADEFPLPRGGDIAGILGRSRADLVEIPRFNIALGPDGLRMPLPPQGPRDYARIDLFIDPEHGARSRIETDPTMTWLRAVPAPKIAVRPGKISRVVRGMHNAHPHPGETLRRHQSRDIVIAHAALTGFPRFRQKIASIRETFDAYGGEMSKKFAWHWQRWLALDDAGELRAEYDRSCLPQDQLEALRAQGIVASAQALMDRQVAAAAEKQEMGQT